MNPTVAQIFHSFNLMLLGAGLFMALRLILFRPADASHPRWILPALLIAALIPAWNLYAEQFSPIPEILVLGWPFSLSYWLPAPLLYLHVMNTLYSPRRPARHWIHLTPFFAAAAFMLIVPDESLNRFRFIVVSWILVTTAYLFSTFVLLAHTRRNHEHNYSQQIKPMYRWFMLLVSGWALFLLWDIYMSTRLLIPMEVPQIEYRVLVLIQSGYLMGIVTYLHWYPLEPVLKVGDEPASRKGRSTPSRLGADAARELAQILENATESGQLFRQPDISLRKMAQAVSVTTHELSEVLNVEMETNFYDYINSKRVRLARQMIERNPQTPITDIAFECGYNSKSAFYAAFKKQCGVTPTQYRASLDKFSVESAPH